MARCNNLSQTTLQDSAIRRLNLDLCGATLRIDDNLEQWSAALSNAATTESELPGIYLGLAELYLRGTNPSLAARPLSTAIQLLEDIHGSTDLELVEPIRQLAELANRQGCYRQANQLYGRLLEIDRANR